MTENINQNTTRMKVGDTEYMIESVFGNEPLEDLLAAYICDRIKGENNSDEAAA
jgi:hypothetical protein